MTIPRLQRVGVHLIVADAGTQSRDTIHQTTVEEYAEGWMAGADFPPLDVFQDRDGTIYLADGFHRLLAAKLIRKSTVPCRVFSGTSRHAFLHACGANATHGLRRTNADKRYMVSILLSDPDWATWTDSRIADVCGVSHPFVSAMRRELQKVPDSAASRVMHAARCGADGKAYPANRKRRAESTTRAAQRSPGPKTDEAEETRQKALAMIRELSDLLLALDIYDDHAKALNGISRAIQRTSSSSEPVFSIINCSDSLLACSAMTAS